MSADKKLVERLQSWLDNEPMLSPGEVALLAETITALTSDKARLVEALEHTRDGLRAIIATNDADWDCEDLRQIARAALTATIGEAR